MAWQSRVTVAVVVEREGRFLLVEEDIESWDVPVFNQPAGHVEKGETLIEAAKREALEETGWEVEITDLLGIYTYAPHQSVNDFTYYRFCFVAQAVHHYNQPLDEGIIRAVWMSLDELESGHHARSPLVARCIRDYMAGKRYPLDMIYEHPAGAVWTGSSPATPSF
ncbi:MAG: NUDIX hydrolase [Fluviicoccus sp.]|uniref:NUDIX hydrolase n=1 Tax=Fluviicoccus sp. TaxID=2003552 RepID=UPI00272590AF|nr:NUDIX hydrolase [Fluviicoccus sp.]MDO8329182.1 NUDIX hydrolase [Fluviicoccus sp.]